MNLFFYIMFNFILYSFIGWMLEEMYSFIITKKFNTDGFLISPLKPMYGTAFFLLVLSNERLSINGIPLIFLCFLIPTGIEYISGYILKKIFNKTYWDYSHLKYNINGLISLKFSLYWTTLSFAGICLLQPAIHNFYLSTKEVSNMAVSLVSIVILLDFVLTLQKYKGNIFLFKKAS